MERSIRRASVASRIAAPILGLLKLIRPATVVFLRGSHLSLACTAWTPVCRSQVHLPPCFPLLARRPEASCEHKPTTTRRHLFMLRTGFSEAAVAFPASTEADVRHSTTVFSLETRPTDDNQTVNGKAKRRVCFLLLHARKLLILGRKPVGRVCLVFFCQVPGKSPTGVGPFRKWTQSRFRH